MNVGVSPCEEHVCDPDERVVFAESKACWWPVHSQAAHQVQVGLPKRLGGPKGVDPRSNVQAMSHNKTYGQSNRIIQARSNKIVL